MFYIEVECELGVNCVVLVVCIFSRLLYNWGLGIGFYVGLELDRVGRLYWWRFWVWFRDRVCGDEFLCFVWKNKVLIK